MLTQKIATPSHSSRPTLESLAEANVPIERRIEILENELQKKEVELRSKDVALQLKDLENHHLAKKAEAAKAAKKMSEEGAVNAAKEKYRESAKLIDAQAKIKDLEQDMYIMKNTIIGMERDATQAPRPRISAIR